MLEQLPIYGDVIHKSSNLRYQNLWTIIKRQMILQKCQYRVNSMYLYLQYNLEYKNKNGRRC
jgi:hypothetical protein